jgi:hypothetical protein
MSSIPSENQLVTINSVEVDYVSFLSGIKKMRIEILVEAAVKIQRFWRKISRKNVFREYRYIF